MTDLSTLFLQNTPLIDVRSPQEFKEGHFPHSTNLPILNDDERHRIGIEYKTQGQDSAVKLGHELVSGAVKSARVEKWRQFFQTHPSAQVYCFRGGLRSQIATQWLRESGQPATLIEGGYKRMRRLLIDTIETRAPSLPLVMIAGRTGVGKTRFLRRADFPVPMLDLEKLADHKGSAFGGLGVVGYQPAQATFENALAIELLRRVDGNRERSSSADSHFAGSLATTAEASSPVAVEDESRSIGAVMVPASLYARMEIAPIVILEKTLKERIQLIVEEYVVEKSQFFGGDAGLTQTFLLNALTRIEKKLGGLNYKNIRALLVKAFSERAPEATCAELSAELIASHTPWIAELLHHYYDPLYDRQIKLRKTRIAFRGTESDCLGYFSQL